MIYINNAEWEEIFLQLSVFNRTGRNISSAICFQPYRSNNIFKWVVEIGDFVLLNLIIYAFFRWHWRMGSWGPGMVEIFILASNAALLLSQIKFPTIIHLRLVGAGDIIGN